MSIGLGLCRHEGRYAGRQRWINIEGTSSILTHLNHSDFFQLPGIFCRFIATRWAMTRYLFCYRALTMLMHLNHSYLFQFFLDIFSRAVRGYELRDTRMVRGWALDR